MISTALWLDAADAATITASGSALSQWNDKSGNARHLNTVGGSGSISTGTRTLNSKNVLDFPGTVNLSRTAFSTTENNGWAYLVTASDATSFSNAGAARFANFACTGTNNRLFAGIGDGDGQYTANRVGARLSSVSSPQDIVATANITTSPIILNFGRSFQSDGVLYINGTLQGNIAPTQNTADHSVQSLTVAGDVNGYLDGLIGEVILLKSLPSTTTRQRIEGYLAHKWGLTANLPAGHPYKTIGPTP
jgi:hypothetical protein